MTIEYFELLKKSLWLKVKEKKIGPANKIFIGMIIGLFWILDMCITATNMVGDITGITLASRSKKLFDGKTFGILTDTKFFNRIVKKITAHHNPVTGEIFI